MGQSTEKAIFAGGCFWGMEELFRSLKGVVRTRVGYTGGTQTSANYEAVKTGKTGHAESLLVEFDPQKTSYAELLRFFFCMHDPTTKDRQGGDHGTQYRSAIFYLNDQQAKQAKEIISEVDKSGKWPAPIITQVVKAETFYDAEEYHQEYLKKNPNGYTCHYVRR